MNNPRQKVTYLEVYVVLVGLENIKKNRDQKICATVSCDEIEKLILLFNLIDQDEVQTTVEGAKDFYTVVLELIERISTVNNIYDFECVISSLKNILTSRVDFISVSLIFQNNESLKLFSIARLEEVLEDMCAHEKSHSNTADDDMCWI